MVYAIVSGTYSDTTYHGYFIKPEDAYYYCMVMNQHSGWDGDYYVDILDEMELDYDPEREIGFQYNVRATKTYCENEWQFTCNEFDISCTEIAERNRISDVEEGYTWESYMITVFLTKYDPEKAKKIAQDMLYKKLSEEEGL